MRCLLACLCAVLAVGACSTDKGFGPTMEVTADEYAGAWPLTVSSALLSCEGGFVLAQLPGGHAFRVDDLVGPKDAHPAFRRIWATNPSQSSGRKDLSPLVEDARELCG